MKSLLRVAFLIGFSVLPVLGQSRAVAAPNPQAGPDPRAARPPAAYEPLTGAQRWHRYWKDTMLSPEIYIASLSAASGMQLGHDPVEWRQGPAGYARRAVSSFSRFTVDESVHQAGAAALGYDPRYMACGCKGVWHRTEHAILWSFLTKNSEGATRFDLPRMAGAYAGGMIPMYWFPHRYTALGDGFRTANQQIGFLVGFDIVREFTPEIKHVFRYKH